MSAQAQLGYAIEDVRRAEVALTNTLAANYTNYQNNLNGLEYYRRWILPDQVRYYRGILLRRQADPNASPADLMTAQQALVANVQNYLGILGTLWSSAVSVADLLQTDDLFQLAQARELPELPDLDNLPGGLCPHPGQAAPAALPSPGPAGVPPVAPARDPVLPPPRKINAEQALSPPEVSTQPGVSEMAGRPSSRGASP
jgi:cobalt-zinc-cadmium efflux system outer membrane protein